MTFGRMKAIFFFFVTALLPVMLVVAQNTQGAELTKNPVPTYHIPMLNDETRNEAYYQALKKVVTPDSIVVDVGSGSGLLSLMAAQLGAKKVFSVEQRIELCDIFPEIVAANHFEGTIELICKSSYSVRADDLMYYGPHGKEPPTILVSETLDSYIFGEGFLAVLYDWKFRGVVQETIQIIPHHGRLHMQLQQTNYLLNDTLTVHGFDFSALDNYRLKHEVIVGRQEIGFHKNLSEVVTYIDFAFANSSREDDFFQYVYLEIPVTATGRLTSLVYYFEVWLDQKETIRLDTFYGSPTHWKQIEKILDWTQSVKPGDIVRLQIGQLSDRMVIVNADTNRLLRINSDCLGIPINIYASRDNEDTCDTHDHNYVSEFHGGKGEYNVFVGFPGQIYMFQERNTGRILPSYQITDKKTSKDTSTSTGHNYQDGMLAMAEYTVDCSVTRVPSRNPMVGKNKPIPLNVP